MCVCLTSLLEWAVFKLFGSVGIYHKCVDACRPADKYKPWFATVLKTCRLAVKVIHMLVEEVRRKPFCGTDACIFQYAGTDSSCNSLCLSK